MEEKNNKTKKIMYISMASMFVILVCLVIFIVLPMAKKVYATKDAFEQKKLEFIAIRRDASDAERFVNLVDSLGEDQKLVEKAVINEDSVVEFIEEIESIANEVENKIEITHFKGETIKTSRPSPKANPNDPEAEAKRKAEEQREKNTVRLELILEGNYKKFLEYYYKLENMAYVFNIESFKVRSAKSSSSLLENEEISTDQTEARIIVAFVPKKS